MAVAERWCRLTFSTPDGAELVSCLLEGPLTPDLRAVDIVARLALVASRLGAGVALSEVSPWLRELLELTGLSVEMERQAERREEPSRVQEGQEEVHPGDPPA